MTLLIQWAITSSALILIVLAVRFLVRDKLSARLRYALWAIVLVRLLAPFQIELPAASETLPLLAANFTPEVSQWEERSIPVFPQSSRPTLEYNSVIFDQLEPGEIKSTETSMGYYQRSQDGETIVRYLDVWSPEQIVLLVWHTGAAAMVLALLASNLRFARRLKKRRRPLENMEAPIPVYAAEGLPSPCLFGVFRPAVYVTSEAAENPDALRHVLAHELTHHAHRDHIWSLLRCLALVLHWYNPLVWLAVVLSKRDGELACDEGAVARLGEGERIPYGRTLVDMVAKRSLHPADLLSCSTAMTGGKKSIQQRVAQLVKQPETVKAALFAVAAAVALAAVFVFAERGPAINRSVITYEEFCQLAQSDSYTQIKVLDEHGPGWIIYQMGSNPELRQLLQSGTASSGECSAPDKVPNALNILFTDVSDGVADSYYMVETGSGCELLASRMGEKEMIYSFRRIAVFPAGTAEEIEALAREQGTDNLPLSALDRFQAQVDSAVSIRYCSPLISSTIYPNPITDPELLTLAKNQLSLFVLQDPDTVVSGWSQKLLNASRIVLSDGKTDYTYALLLGEDGRTYLFSGDDVDYCWRLGEGETMEVTPIARTENRHNMEGSLISYARLQVQRAQDPNTPVPLTPAELSQYTPYEIWRTRSYHLMGWDGDLRDAKFHYGLTSPKGIQLWYWGDENHEGVWVLELQRPEFSADASGITVVSDQPMEVFNAAQNTDMEKSYEQIGPGAFAACLRPEDVTATGLRSPSGEQAAVLDLQALKPLITEALYHQLSGEHTEEKYGQYAVTLYVEKDVGYYLKDGGEDGLTLSIGSEPDVVCMRHRILASPQREIHQYVYSPELYRAIQNLFE